MEPNANADNTEPNQNMNSGSEDTKGTSASSLTNTAEVAKPASPFFNLLENIQSSKTSNQEELNGEVVKQLVEEDKSKKVGMLLKGITKFREAEAEVKKIKPDNVQYDGDGKITSQSYTKETAEKLKKAKELVEKIKKAMDLACNQEKPDYSKLQELVK